MKEGIAVRGSLEEAGLPFWRECLLFTVLALLGIGLVVGYSLAGTDLDRSLGQAMSSRALRLSAGLAAFFLCVRIPTSWIRKAAPWLFLAAVLCCFLPRLLGMQSKGTYRWIRLGALSLQPVEWLKPLLVLALASRIAGRRTLLEDFRRGLLPALWICGAAFVALLSQPDIGHAFFLLSVAFVLLLVGGMRIRHALWLSGSGAVVLALVLTNTYRHAQDRLRDFLGAQPGYQIQQGLAAIQAGGWFGRGLGAGRERMFIPEARNDFVLAALGNEWGLAGSLAVVALFLLFFLAVHRIARACRDPWHRLAALGLGATIAFQAFFNMLGVTHTIPEKGIDLPFLSSGGTNLFFALASVGVLANIASSEASGRRSGSAT